ncbi:DUF2188 domain-containing protein [Arthrobacter sp. KNU40]|uniref:DUF2188 domain-containing protein n=1 Tax=Arthrobacter sp. KNU40 TaxID=3447965 RepID=UPI003F6362AC
MTNNNYNVYKRGDDWVAKGQDSNRASAIAGTQADAYAAAAKFSSNKGGGDVTVSGVDGKFRYKNTIKPSSDPRSSPG